MIKDKVFYVYKAPEDNVAVESFTVLGYELDAGPFYVSSSVAILPMTLTSILAFTNQSVKDCDLSNLFSLLLNSYVKAIVELDNCGPKVPLSFLCSEIPSLKLEPVAKVLNSEKTPSRLF